MKCGYIGHCIAIAVFLLLAPVAWANQGDLSTYQIVGQVGGSIQAVDVQGSYAYIGVGLRLTALDISVSAAPVELGSSTPFPQVVEDIVVRDDTAYVAIGMSGIGIVDVSDAIHPIKTGVYDTPGYAEGIAVAGQYAYVADGPYGLRIIDISDPANLSEIASAYTLNYVFDIAIEGQYAYLAAAGAGLLLVDISDPFNPIETGSYNTYGYAYGVKVVGDMVYIADGWEGLRIVNVTFPDHPVEVGLCRTPGWALEVDISYPIAYVANGGRGLSMVDISDYSHPVEVGRHEISGVAVTLVIEDDIAYVADKRMGLRIIDVHDAQSPIQVSLYSPLADAFSLDVQGNYAYVASGFSGLRVVDISDVYHPREIGAYPTASGYASDVVVRGDYAYLCHLPGAGVDSDSYELHVVDISDPANPTIAGGLDASGSWWDIELVNGVIFGADEWGLRIIDVSEPYAPAEIGSIELAENGDLQTNGVAIHNGIAYVSAGGRLNVVDITNLSNPSRIGVQDWDGITDLTIAGNRAYAAKAYDGLGILDISNPLAPVQIGSYNTPGISSSIALSGSLAYISDGRSGIQIIDVSDPSNLKLVAACHTPGSTRFAVVKDNSVFAADNHVGLVVLKEVSGGPSQLEKRSNPLNHPIRTIISSSSQFTVNRSGSPVINHPGDVKIPLGSVLDASPKIHIVTSAADKGPGTLRWCLDQAKSGDTIVFDSYTFPPTAPKTISLVTMLPSITQSNLSIDASNHGVILDGGQEIEGGLSLEPSTNGNKIKGLQIRNFSSYGIYIGGNNNIIGGDRTIGTGHTGGGNVIYSNGFSGLILDGSYNTISGNLIGTDSSGGKKSNNQLHGIIDYGTDNTIGGITPGERNIISGNNRYGIYMHGRNSTVIGNYIGIDITGTKALGSLVGVIIEWSSSNIIAENIISGNDTGIEIVEKDSIHNSIIGNFIGTDKSGSLALGNQTGIKISGDGFNRIGGTENDDRNIISGNKTGISIGELNNVVIGNYIGTDTSGNRAIGNDIGIEINTSCCHNFVGGFTTGEGNLISGNSVGVRIFNGGVENNWIIGNYIGTNASGTAALANNSDGIYIEDYAMNNLVQSNLIGYNSGSGVIVSSGAYNNTIRQNSIHSHPGKGIILTEDGNNMLSPPTITNAILNRISGTALPGCKVEIFSDTQDEGHIYEGSVIADSLGAFIFSKESPFIGPHITATATDTDGNTSEFSIPRKLRESPPWDVDNDGIVSICDLALVAIHYGEIIAASSYPNPDINGDGVVDISDLVLVGKHLGETY